jgi:selenocysteine-specific elongation factor
VATGTLTSGRLAVDDALEVMPGGRLVKVRGLQVHGARRPAAEVGERVAVNISGADVADLARGQALVSPGTLPATSIVDVVVVVVPSAPPLRHGARVRFHQGTAEILARIATVGPFVDGAAPALEAGQTSVARLRLETTAALTRGDRFVLRSYSPSVTIAGGRVLDPGPPPGGVRARATAERLARLRGPFEGVAGEDEALRIFLDDTGAWGASDADLMARAGAHDAAGRLALAQLRTRPDVWQVGDRLLAAPWRAALADLVIAALEAHHDSQPLSDGLSREEVRERVLAGAHPEVATAVLDQLEDAGKVRGRERLALVGRGVTLTVDEAAAQAALATAYGDAGLTPPESEGLAALLGLPPALVTRVTQLLIRQQVLVRVDAFVFHRDALARLKADVLAMKAAGSARVDVAGFKDRYGLTRKFAIPLLEYLDRERVTRRMGDSRIVL